MQWNYHRTAEQISGNVERAIRNYEMFEPTARNARLIASVNATKVNPGFNVASDAIHRETVSALCRLWDRTPRTASIPQLANRLRRPAGLAEVEAKFGPIDRKKLADWLDAVDAVKNSEELSALETARHMYLAHDADKNIHYRGKDRAAVYGDELKVLEATIQIAEFANEITGSPDRKFGNIRAAWKAEAKKFWNAVARTSLPENEDRS